MVVAAGGATAELSRDSAVRLAPIGPADAEAMLRQTATFPLLDGYRGAPQDNLDELCDVIAELAVNPVIASPAGSFAVDARIRLTAPRSPALIAAKRIR